MKKEIFCNKELVEFRNLKQINFYLFIFSFALFFIFETGKNYRKKQAGNTMISVGL